MADPDGHLERCKPTEDPINPGHIPPILLLGSLYLLGIGLCVLVYDYISILFDSPHFGPFVSRSSPQCGYDRRTKPVSACSIYGDSYALDRQLLAWIRGFVPLHGRSEVQADIDLGIVLNVA